MNHSLSLINSIHLLNSILLKNPRKFPHAPPLSILVSSSKFFPIQLSMVTSFSCFRTSNKWNQIIFSLCLMPLYTRFFRSSINLWKSIVVLLNRSPLGEYIHVHPSPIDEYLGSLKYLTLIKFYECSYNLFYCQLFQRCV
jgi:hypothetical protein